MEIGIEEKADYSERENMKSLECHTKEFALYAMGTREL